MQKCSVCGSENQTTSLYCERCGSLLKASTIPTNSEVEYTIPGVQMPPPPPTYSTHQTPPSSPYTIPYQSGETPRNRPDYYPSHEQTYQPSGAKPQSVRTVGNTVLGIILYLIGAGCAALGTFGGLETFIGESWATVSLLAVLLISAILFIAVLVHYRSTHLRWWQRLLLWFSLSGLITLITLLSYGIQEARYNGSIPTATEDVVFGSAFIAYGLITMFLAFW